MKKLFSIGTVIRVGKGEDLLMIVTRFPLTVKNNIKGYYDYGACIYPVGVQANEELYLTMKIFRRWFLRAMLI